MNCLHRISSALNLSAIVCLLAFNGWLQFHHGHHPADGLFPGKTSYSRAVITVSAEERHACGAPEITAHELRLVFPHGCLICTLFNWNTEPQSPPALSGVTGAATVIVPIQATVRASIPRSACRLRAPPLSA